MTEIKRTVAVKIGLGQSRVILTLCELLSREVYSLLERQKHIPNCDEIEVGKIILTEAGMSMTCEVICEFDETIE